MTLLRMLRLPRSLLRAWGLDVVRYVPSRANTRRLRAMQEHRVDLVLDVGASDGGFASKLRSSGYEGRILSFEPSTEGYEALVRASARDPLWQTQRTAIGDQDGEVSINISGRGSSSSILPMLPSHVAAAPDSAYVAREQVPIRRLDSMLDDVIGRAHRLYIKIDVQGYERAVLQGAESTLATTEMIEVEVSMIPLYEGSVLYAEMIGSLHDRGFRLVSWEDVLAQPETGYVLQADCIFVRGG